MRTIFLLQMKIFHLVKYDRMPANAESILPPENAPHIEYPVYIADTDSVDVDVIIGQTLNFVPGRGWRLALSFDDERQQVVDAFPNMSESYKSRADSVRENARTLRSTHEIRKAGRHLLKITMVAPAVVLQQLIVHRHPLPQTYLGPHVDTVRK